MRHGSTFRWAIRSIIFLTIVIGLTPTFVADCIDEEASDPGFVRIQVTIQSVQGSASIDGDNILFDNEADLTPHVSINGGPWDGGSYIEGDDTPHFQETFEVEVPRGLRVVPIRIRLSDRDLPDESDWIDLDPAGGCEQDIHGDDPDCSLELWFDTCCYSFTGDGTANCPDGICAGGADGHWLGPGDHNEHASIRVAVRMGDRRPVCNEGDVYVESAEFVQVVDQPGFAVSGRGSILRVTFGSTFEGSVNTTVVGNIGDEIGPDATEVLAVTLDHCEVRTENFFVSDPVVVEISRAHYGGKIDPDGILPYTDPCARVNDGSDDANNIDIRPARDLSVLYQRFHYLTDCVLAADCDSFSLLSAADAATEAADADIRIRGFFPAPQLDTIVDPVPLWLPAPDIVLGPRSEIQVLSEAAALLGLDRVVGLVPFNWVDAHGYVTVPVGTIGVSNGKIGPHFVFSESNSGLYGFTPVHELGHTFGLSDEPCSVDDFEIWSLYLCEDEYNAEVFRNRPEGGFQGKGFDVPRGIEAAGTCFMDSDSDAWISNNDFESLVRKMAPGHDPRVLVVTGYVTNAAGGELMAAIGLDDGIPDRVGLTDSPFSLVLRNSSGSVLGEYGIFDDMQGEDEDTDGILEAHEILGDYDDNGVPDRLPVSHPSDVDEDMNGIPDAAERAEFALRIPWPLETASVDLVGPFGAVIHTLVVEAGSPPEIELLEPIGEFRLDPAHAADLLVPVRWRLNGGKGLKAGPVQGVSIAASYDGGATWIPRAHRVSGGAFVIDAHGITEPLAMQLKVVALVNGPAGIDTTAADTDHDGCPDPIDPFPTAPQTVDGDGDGVPDACDRCLQDPDPLQTDADQDGYGDACDADYDQDGLVTPDDDSGGFQPCLGQNVVMNPDCYDRDFDGDGVVTAADGATGFQPLLLRGMPGPSALVPDADSDGVGDLYDCAPASAAEWKVPKDVTGVMVGPSVLGPDHVALSWDSLAASAGPGTVYDLLTGPLSDLAADGGYVSLSCLAGDHAGTAADPVQSPPPLPDGWWYLVRAENACGLGTWGNGTPTPDPRDALETVNCTAPEPALGVFKNDAPDPVQAGGLLTYTITFQNSGNANATNTVITDTVPANTAFVSATGGGVLAGDIVSWSLGTVPAGGSGVVQMAVQVASPLPSGTTITNGAYAIDCDQTGPVNGNSVLTTVVSAPVLGISKSDAPDPVATSGVVTYTISFQNSGNANATGVVVRDTVPAGAVFVSATDGGYLGTGGVVIWNVGLLPAGSAPSVQMAVRAISGSTLTNGTYSIDSDETAPVSGAPVTTTVLPPPTM